MSVRSCEFGGYVVVTSKNVVLSCCHGNTFNIRNRCARQILIPEESSGVGRAEDKAGFTLQKKVLKVALRAKILRSLSLRGPRSVIGSFVLDYC